MNTAISLSRLHFPVTTLGPGRRIGIWFQGCSIRCAGCISADTWGFRQSETTVADVMVSLEPWFDIADGITLSGGEPFDQSDALWELLQRMRARTDSDVLVFSGYAHEAIAERLGQFGGLIDALVTDPFDIEQSSTRGLRGSANQRLWCLTDRGTERFQRYDEPGCHDSPALDVSFQENGQVWFAGIPKHGDFQRLKAMLEGMGHQVRTTEDTSWRRRK